VKLYNPPQQKVRLIYVDLSDVTYYKEMQQNYETVMRSFLAREYERTAFLYIRQALAEYLEWRERERTRGKPRFAKSPYWAITH
jgi:hypothetical protein